MFDGYINSETIDSYQPLKEDPMTTPIHRIQPVAPGIVRECLAERVHIFTDWPARLNGELVGEAQFDNAWFLRPENGTNVLARDATPAPPLRITLADAAVFTVDLPQPITTLTLEHLAFWLSRLHASEMEKLLAPPEPESGNSNAHP